MDTGATFALVAGRGSAVVKSGRVVRFGVRNLRVVLPQDGQDHRVAWSVRNELDQVILNWNARMVVA